MKIIQACEVLEKIETNLNAKNGRRLCAVCRSRSVALFVCQFCDCFLHFPAFVRSFSRRSLLFLALFDLMIPIALFVDSRTLVPKIKKYLPSKNPSQAIINQIQKTLTVAVLC
jgi:hypothetical protein